MSSSASSSVLIYVQHLLGVGHLQRAVQLATALLERGFRVDLVSGGMPVDSNLPQALRFHQLPPLYSADGSFKRLLDANGEAIDDTWREQRKQQLLAIFDACAPRVLITETFPFGRRMLRFELLPLLQASRVSCDLVLASVRDILQPRANPERYQETCDWLEAYYDKVLVHGDEQLVRLEHSFALTERIAQMLYYSGYIHTTGTPPETGAQGQDEVIVSAGGSATGLQILQTAIAARPLSDCRQLRWRLLVSPAIAEADFQRLRQHSGNGLRIERNRPDFGHLLQRARVSISQCGYNTMTDVLGSNTAAVVIPYAEAKEVEQSLRAQALQERGRVIVLNAADLDPQSLAQAVNQAQTQNIPLAVNLDGAANSAAMIAQWLKVAAKRPGEVQP